MNNLARIGVLVDAGNKNILEAAELIAVTLTVDNLDEICRQIKGSEDKVYRMARAGKMRLELKSAEICNVAKIELSYSHWEAVYSPYRKELMTLEEVAEVLKLASDNEWSVEMLRTRVPSIPKPVDFRSVLKRYFDRLDKDLIHTPYGDVPEEKAVKVSQAAKILNDAIFEALEY